MLELGMMLALEVGVWGRRYRRGLVSLYVDICVTCPLCSMSGAAVVCAENRIHVHVSNNFITCTPPKWSSIQKATRHRSASHSRNASSTPRCQKRQTQAILQHPSGSHSRNASSTPRCRKRQTQAHLQHPSGSHPRNTSNTPRCQKRQTQTNLYSNTLHSL